MTDRPAIDHSRAALALRTAGRRGDSVLAHLTPGEVVVPVSVLRAVPGLGDLLAESFTRANLDLGRYTVGGPDDSVNPATGLPEYYDEEPGDTWGGADDDWGGSDGGDWGGGDDPYDFEDKKTGGYGGERSKQDFGSDFEELSDDGGTYEIIDDQGIDARVETGPGEELATPVKMPDPKKGRTLLGGLNIRRATLSFSERLGSVDKGKRLLGQ